MLWVVSAVSVVKVAVLDMEIWGSLQEVVPTLLRKVISICFMVDLPLVSHM